MLTCPVFACLQPTPAFLGSAVNRTRLRELLQFVLSHFTNGPDARRLNELLQTSQPVAATSSSGGGAQAPQPPPAAAGTATAAASAAAGAAAGASGAPPPVRQGPMQPSPAAVAAVTAAAPLAGGLLSAGGAGPGAPGVPAYALQALRLESSSLSERVQKTALLAPLVGILLALWDSYLTATAAAVPSLGPAAAASAVAAAALDGEVALAGAAAGGSNGSSIGSQSALLQELAEVADERFMTSLRFLQVRWGRDRGAGTWAAGPKQLVPSAAHARETPASCGSRHTGCYLPHEVNLLVCPRQRVDRSCVPIAQCRFRMSTGVLPSRPSPCQSL
jgi:hypothetical protein